MSDLSRYNEKIDALAGQLEKLFKVINHSDPSAETVKHILYDKYKSTLTNIANDLKSRFSWSTVSQHLTGLQKADILTLESGVSNIVYRKLFKDFEDEFITRHKLSEFTPPEPGDEKQKERIRRIRKQIRNNRKKQNGSTVPSADIGELFRVKNREKKAKSSLDKLVKVFNNIDPSQFEH